MAAGREEKKVGQSDLLRRVLEENHPAIRRFLRFLTRGMYPAEDLAQEVALRALRAEKVPGTESEVMAWVFRIARNLVIDEVRKAKRWRSKEISLTGEGSGMDQVLSFPVEPRARHAVSRKEMENVLSDALDELDESSLELVTLRFFGGLSTTEIARTMSLPVGTVCAKIFRATRKMRNYLETRGYSFSELDPGE